MLPSRLLRLLTLSCIFRLLTLFCSAIMGLLSAQPGHARAANSSIVASVVAEARSLLGAPYAYIGDDPGTGFSCIGFVHYVYGQFGVTVLYNLQLAYAAGPRVAESQLQAGDLVFFSNTVWRGLSHVALYIGGGQIIGADTVKTGVEQSPLSDPYWVAHYTGATRPLATTIGTAPASSTSPPRPTPTPPALLRLRAGEMLTARQRDAVYSGPGYIYQPIDHVAPPTVLRVVRTQGAWANVVYAAQGMSLYGWVEPSAAGAYAVATPPRPSQAQTATRPSAPPTAVVAVPVLMLRAGPSTDQPILRQMVKGKRVTVLGRRQGWDRVRDGKAIGWAFARWLS